MDFETGEGFPDKETGELPAMPHLNCETGERELNCSRPEQLFKKPFKIPNNYKTNHGKCSPCENTPKENVKRRVIFTNTNPHSPVILFLLPTLILFIPAITIPLGIIEIFLHLWAHKKNKKLRDKDIYYQSPLHVFVSEFCASCRFESSKNKITKMQDKRNKKKFFKYGIEYVRRIV